MSCYLLQTPQLWACWLSRICCNDTGFCLTNRGETYSKSVIPGHIWSRSLFGIWKQLGYPKVSRYVSTWVVHVLKLVAEDSKPNRHVSLPLGSCPFSPRQFVQQMCFFPSPEWDDDSSILDIDISGCMALPWPRGCISLEVSTCDTHEITRVGWQCSQNPSPIYVQIMM